MELFKRTKKRRVQRILDEANFQAEINRLIQSEDSSGSSQDQKVDHKIRKVVDALKVPRASLRQIQFSVSISSDGLEEATVQQRTSDETVGNCSAVLHNPLQELCSTSDSGLEEESTAAIQQGTSDETVGNCLAVPQTLLKELSPSDLDFNGDTHCSIQNESSSDFSDHSEVESAHESTPDSQEFVNIAGENSIDALYVSNAYADNAGDVSCIDDAQPPALTLSQELADWAVRRSVSHAALDSLLPILQRQGHPELPKNAKTLLETPRNTHQEIKVLGGGEFWYGGILNGIKSRLSFEDFQKRRGQTVIVDVFVDGISPHTSVKKHLVAIAGCVLGELKPFEIALWCGKANEPDNVNDFFESFIEETKRLKNDGFTIDGIAGSFSFRIEKFIGDALGRAWMLQNVVPPHSFFCCERCAVKGRRICSRTIFDPHEEGTLRTDETLASQSQSEHHAGTTPLVAIEVKQLSDFPIDPMHNVYQGVERRFWQFLASPKNKKASKISLRNANMLELSEYLTSLKPYYPSEFNRQLRPLLEWSQYKASELRRLCLYDGFILLPELTMKKISKVHNLLACGIRILADRDFVGRCRSDADRLLRKFVAESTKLFGELFPTFNVHCLIHLPDETSRHGTLMEFSAWKYESYLGQIKKRLRAPGKTLQQIVCRLMEKRKLLSSGLAAKVQKDSVRVSQPHATGPILQTCDEQFRFLSLPDIGEFRVHSANDLCFVTSGGEVCVARNITRSRGKIEVLYNAFLETEDLFDYPFSSRFLGICKVKTLGPLKSLPLGAIKHKAVLLPNKCDIVPEPARQWMNESECICLPMLHHQYDLSEITES